MKIELRNTFSYEINRVLSSESSNPEFKIDLANLFSKIADQIIVENIASTSPTLESYNDAAIHYTYSIEILNGYAREISDEESLTKIKNIISQVELKLLQLHSYILHMITEDVSLIEESCGKTITELSKRDFVESIRLMNKRLTTDYQNASYKYSEDLRASYEQVADSMKGYLKSLIEESISIVGNPPCKYTVIGLGSMAMRHITPYSDLEFAILVERSDPEIIEYFKIVSHYVNFRVICLGETSLPTSYYGINLDDLLQRGINFDLGGKTPLGRVDKEYELICTPDTLFQYLTNNYHVSDKNLRDEKLPFVVENQCYICGNDGGYEESLLKDFQEKAKVYMESFSPEGVPVHIVRAKSILTGENLLETDNAILGSREGFLKMFIFDPYEKEGYKYDVKQDLYRLPDRLIYELGLIQSIYPAESGLSAFDIISRLELEGKLNPLSAEYFRETIFYSIMLRLRVYDYYSHQMEAVDIIPRESVTAEFVGHFQLSIAEIEDNGPLFRYYFTSISLHKFLNNLCAHLKTNLDYLEVSNKLLEEKIFFEDSNENKAKIYMRLSMYRKSLEYHLIFLEETKSVYGEESHNFGVASNNIGNIYCELGEYQRALPFLQAYNRISIVLNGEDAPDVEISYNNLGLLCIDIGDFKTGLEFFEKSLSLRLKKSGPMHETTAICYGNIGNLYREVGDFEKSESCLSLSLKIISERVGQKSHQTASCYDSLGSLYYDMGQYDKALENQVNALNIRLVKYGGNHRDTVRSFINVGETYLALGNTDLAMYYQNKALSVIKIIFGEDHPSIASCYSNIGNIYLKLGDYENSLIQHSLALKIRIAQYGNHPETAISYSNMGNVFSGIGEYEEALNFHKKALEIRVEKYGQNHYETADTLSNITEIYIDMGEYEEAFENEKLALKIKLSVLSENHPSIGVSYNNIGNALIHMEKIDEALENFIKAIEIWSKTYGENHESIASVNNNIGAIYYKVSEYDQAELYQNEALRIYTNIYEPEHECVGIAHNALAMTYRGKKEFEKAIFHQETALNIFRKNLGESHSYIAIANNNLALIYIDMSNYTEALVYAKKALELWIENSGIDHPDTSKGYSTVASIYSACGQYELALENFLKALDIRISKLGKTHTNTINTYYDIAEQYTKLGLIDKAEENTKIAEELMLLLNEEMPEGYILELTGDN